MAKRVNVKEALEQIKKNTHKEKQEEEEIKETVNVWAFLGTIADYKKHGHVLTNNAKIEIVSEVYGVSIQEIKGKKRNRGIVDARKACAKILYTPKFSLKRVGELLGDRDHATVINLISGHRVLMQVDSNYRDKFLTVSATLSTIRKQ